MKLKIAKEHSYVDIVNRLYDLKSFAVKPDNEERSGQLSSYDRRSVYNGKAGTYRH